MKIDVVGVVQIVIAALLIGGVRALFAMEKHLSKINGALLLHAEKLEQIERRTEKLEE